MTILYNLLNTLFKWNYWKFIIIVETKSNCTIRYFTVTALYSLVQEVRADPTKVAVQNNIVINQKDLVDKALRVCDILKYEFIFCKPCQVLEEVIENTINNLAYTGVIVLKEVCNKFFSFLYPSYVQFYSIFHFIFKESYLEEELWSRRFARNFDDSSDEDHQIQTQDRKIEYKVSSLTMFNYKKWKNNVWIFEQLFYCFIF